MNKLYVLSRKDLGLVYQAVQSGHALAQWCLEHPKNYWQNQTLIYLEVKNEKKLLKWREKLRQKGIEVSEFVEPDVDYKVTAIACFANENLFKKLDLLGTDMTGLT